MSKKIQNIVILKGGWNSEREVSLMSAKSVAQAARDLGYCVKEVDVKRDLIDLVQHLTPKPDVVINILHGSWGEDGRIQAVLDILGIPYTFSNYLASAMAMDKPTACTLMKAAGLPIAQGKEFKFSELSFNTPPFPYPFVIKPPCEGSSVGVSLIFEEKDYHTALKNWNFGERVFIEKYIPGLELSTAVMGDQPLGTLCLCPKTGFYDYERKYTDGLTEHIMPAPISEDHYQLSLDLARQAVKLLGCTGISRVDFRYNKEDKIHPLRILEVNTQPGMTKLSIVPEIAAYQGLSFHDIVKWMIENAICHG